MSASLRGRLTVADGPEGLAELAACRVEEILARALADRGRASFGLAGGTTPDATYRHLAARAASSDLDWARVEVFQGDERCVPPTAPESNFRRATEILLSRLPGPVVHRIPAEQGAERAASVYARLLEERLGNPPRLDLALLGLGDDGHTASLFPDGGAADGWVVASRSPVAPYERVTLTHRTLDLARHVIVLVSGATKGDALVRVARQEDVPAAHLAPERLEWIVDVEAATGLAGLAGIELLAL
ncbi:MAG: 6-phosphogluconolactonase [Thermoanaerobaculia bacterium]